MKPCPTCKEDKAKLRTGSLGEPKGVWCTACGRSTDTVEAWENAWRADETQERAYAAVISKLNEPMSAPVGRPATDPTLASGSGLTSLAWMVYGVVRHNTETDEELRERIRRANIV